MKHSPAPWSVGAADFPTHGGVYAADHVIVASVGHSRDAAESSANAALISAAPDLLAACIAAAHILVGFPPDDDYPDTLDELLSAIAKAGG